MSERKPAEVFPPGEYLADELEERGWSQADFAGIIGRPVQFVSEIINAKKELTAESASQIAAALGSEASTWLGLQANYQLWRLDQEPGHQDATASLADRARVAQIIPLTALERRGDVAAGASMSDLLAEVMRDFGMTSFDDTPRFGLAAKRANATEDLSLTQRGWLWVALRRARTRQVPHYDEAAFRRLLDGLTHEVSDPEHLAALPERFAAVGVRLVFVEHLAGGKIDGAAFMLDSNPVVAISGRGKRFDKLYFALLHECGHVVAGHIRDGFTLDDQADALTDSRDQARESEANDLAEGWCLGGPVKVGGSVTAQAIEAVARQRAVPTAFVIGNLQHHGILPWRTTLARGLPNADDVIRRWWPGLPR